MERVSQACFLNLQALPHNHLLEPHKAWGGGGSLLNGREWEDRREMK